MKSNYKALYELVERIDERNSDGSVTDLLGVSIDKCFIKSVANTNGTDLTKYKVRGVFREISEILPIHHSGDA